LFSNFFEVGTLPLSLQTPQEAKQRAGISGVLFEIGAKDSLGTLRLAVLEQRGAERFANGIKPFGRLT
jgi:hypothetical protein